MATTKTKDTEKRERFDEIIREFERLASMTPEGIEAEVGDENIDEFARRLEAVRDLLRVGLRRLGVYFLSDYTPKKRSAKRRR